MIKRHLAILFIFVMAAGVFSAAGDASNVVSDDNNNAVIASTQPVTNVTEIASPPCALSVQMYQSADIQTAFTKTNDFRMTNLAGDGGPMTDVIKDINQSNFSRLNHESNTQNMVNAAQVRSGIKESPPDMQASYYKSSSTKNNTELVSGGTGPNNPTTTLAVLTEQTKKMKNPKTQITIRI